MCQGGAYVHIWAYVFGHNSAIFEPIGLKLFVGAQETIIYRLLRKMGMATTRATYALQMGPQNPTKKLAHWVAHLDQLLS